MAIRPYTRSNPKDRPAAEIESQLSACWDSIIKNPLLQNLVIVKDIVIITSDTIVSHNLGKPILGFIVIRKNANATVYESTTANTSPSGYVILKASATVTVSILFF